MAINPIAVAIPVFFIAIGLEYGVSRLMGRSVYRFNDAIADLSCGITQQATNLFTKGLTAAVYIGIYQTLRLWELPDSHWGTWAFAFVFTDFAYYLWHRWTHEMNLGWATHVVHHQSEDYNLAVALRQSISSSWTSWPFYLPMALLGVSPLVAFTCNALNTLYQFWIHTELIGKLGPVGWVMNTPSHHRVHHGVNPQYLDRNYAGVFIVWDRLFGTFEPEGEAVRYGTVKPLESFNPLWANVSWALDLLPHPHRWLRSPAADPKPEAVPDGKYDPVASVGVMAYIAVQFIPVTVGVTALLWFEDLAPIQQAIGASLIVLTTVVWGGLLEGKRWAEPLEIGRLLGLGAATGAFLLS